MGVAAFLLLGLVLIAPVQAARGVKASYHALPVPVKKAVPDAAEEAMGRAVDSVARFLTFGSRARLIQLDLRLLYSSVPPGGWGSNPRLTLAWTDLGNGIAYEIHAGHSREGNGVDVDLGRVAYSNATVVVPGDGDWYVRVRPFAGPEGGRESTFGPFRIDSSPPDPPNLGSIAPPPGYTFTLTWSKSTDTSGIAAYQVERLGSGSLFQVVARTTVTAYTEDQVGNGRYSYRVRAVNGAGLLSDPSNVEEVTIRAPMQNPGPGAFRYGVHANYTSFLKLWDISDPGKYARIDDVPEPIKQKYRGGGWGFEVDNQTLISKTRELVGFERNTLVIAERLFAWLFDWADYDTDKLNASLTSDATGLQSAGVTYDRRKGICGDLATLYITMLRIAGVPARPVHGYLDNPVAGIGDFHVWVEVWVGTSLRSGDPTDTRNDWMPVDVSGITGPYEPSALMIYFGLFNPEYLALGLDADYDDPSWNSWAQFGWTRRQGPGMEPRFTAGGRPTELSFEVKNLFFNPQTKQRELVAPGEDPPTPEFRNYYPDVKVVSKKRIDFGVDLGGSAPINATIRIRYPVADAFAAVLPWQSVIYTIYENTGTVNQDPATGRNYRLEPLGFVVWEDDFR